MSNAPVILVVDDQPLNIELLEAHLAPQGYAILTAADGEEALKTVRENTVDLALLDVKRFPSLFLTTILHCRRIRRCKISKTDA